MKPPQQPLKPGTSRIALGNPVVHFAPEGTFSTPLPDIAVATFRVSQF